MYEYMMNYIVQILSWLQEEIDSAFPTLCMQPRVLCCHQSSQCTSCKIFRSMPLLLMKAYDNLEPVFYPFSDHMHSVSKHKNDINVHKYIPYQIIPCKPNIQNNRRSSSMLRFTIVSESREIHRSTKRNSLLMNLKTIQSRSV
jgi:hypothetical protein